MHNTALSFASGPAAHALRRLRLHRASRERIGSKGQPACEHVLLPCSSAPTTHNLFCCTLPPPISPVMLRGFVGDRYHDAIPQEGRPAIADGHPSGHRRKSRIISSPNRPSQGTTKATDRPGLRRHLHRTYCTADILHILHMLPRPPPAHPPELQPGRS
jgi:hypothetical protein